MWSFSRLVLWEVDDTTTWWSAMLAVEPHIKADEVPELLSFLIGSGYHAESETDSCKFLGVKLGSTLVLTLVERRQDEYSQALCAKLLRCLLSSGSDDWSDAPVILVHDNFLRVRALIKDEKYETAEGLQSTHHEVRTLSDDEVNAAWDFFASVWYMTVRTEIKNAPRGNMKLKVSGITNPSLCR